MMVEHHRLVKQRLGKQQRTGRIAGQKHTLSQGRRRMEVDQGRGYTAAR
jgi:hypothetical protein